MALIVQKFGGSSVADVGRMRRCAQRIIAARDAGHDVVVVVSAMGKTTDGLVELAREASSDPETGEPSPKGPSKRELDMLLSTGERISIAAMAMVLHALGYEAVSFTGRQIGMVTDDAHTRARIASVDSETMKRELAAGRIVVVAGFQGVTERGEVTTLGRGGSDTTAVAVAAALQADVCEIFTDVDGVYTTDPRLVPAARKLERISYDEMLEMASLGAKVMHSRAVEFGARYGVPIHVRHSHRLDEGTMIVKEVEKMEDLQVTGVVLKPNLGRITLDHVPDSPGVAATIFARLAGAGVVVDDIIQTVGDGVATIAFTVDHSDLPDVKPLLDATLTEIGGGHASIEVGFAKISAVGVGIRSHASVASAMFRALAEGGVNIANITTSEIKISVIVDKGEGEKALRVVHRALGLEG
ncbi:MAG: aspartate kinase [Phycisphaerales bacterium]|nr:aspartate kinase [Phycisphaerales bacterium]